LVAASMWVAEEKPGPKVIKLRMVAISANQMLEI
jgi:hypothetical protein